MSWWQTGNCRLNGLEDFVIQGGANGIYPGRTHSTVMSYKKELIIQRFLSSMPVRFEVAKDDVWINGAVIEVDENTGLASNITRLQRRIQ